MLYRFIGVSLCIVGVIFNEWVIRFISSGEIIFDSIIKSLVVIAVQLFFILLGAYIFRAGKNALQNISLSAASILIIIILMELILNIPALQSLDSSTPLWIPWKYKIISREINRSHEIVSRKNTYGFNDQNHNFKKSDSTIKG